VALLVLSGRDVSGLLPYPELVEVTRQALAARARGEAYQPLRTVLHPPGAAGLLALMPCYLPPPAGGRRRGGPGLR
jgi:ornithine cyclodeaminase